MTSSDSLRQCTQGAHGTGHEYLRSFGSSHWCLRLYADAEGPPSSLVQYSDLVIHITKHVVVTGYWKTPKKQVKKQWES